MKRIIFASVMIMASTLAVFASEERVELQIVSLSTLTSVEMESILTQALGNVVVEFPSGTILPVKFFLRGDLVTFVEQEKEIGQVKMEKTIYVRLIKEEFLFSLDLIEWKSLLDLVTGRVDVSLDIEETIPTITFGVEAGQRK